MGALYGLAMEFAHEIRRHDLLSGLGYGGLVLGIADEIAVRAASLSKTGDEGAVGVAFLWPCGASCLWADGGVSPQSSPRRAVTSLERISTTADSCILIPPYSFDFERD
jgi:hypothetical protein